MAILCTLLLLQCVHIWKALYIPWWFNTDEAFYLSEVARFLGGDFRQTYFDIPGTPIYWLTALLMLGAWALATITGFSPPMTPQEFGFEHLQGMVTLMRLETLTFSLLACLLTYAVLRRLTNALGALTGAALVATLPIYIQYSHFVRSESLGLSLCMGAWLLLLRSPEERRKRAYALAGIACGFAMAARFHFGLVGLPLLASHYYAQQHHKDKAKAPLAKLAWLGILGVFIAGALYSALVRTGRASPNLLTDAMLISAVGAPQTSATANALAPSDVSQAAMAIMKLWWLLGAAALGALLL